MDPFFFWVCVCVLKLTRKYPGKEAGYVAPSFGPVTEALRIIAGSCCDSGLVGKFAQGPIYLKKTKVVREPTSPIISATKGNDGSD